MKNVKVIVCPNRGETGKMLGVAAALPPSLINQDVLDVGSRSGKFEDVLRLYVGINRYIAVDLQPPADVIADLGIGLPIADSTFDFVVALDVLEHIDSMHQAFEELVIAATSYVVITLPNAFEIRGRLKFLSGKSISGKYGLPTSPPRDRHRWIFSFDEAAEFTRNMAARCGCSLVSEACLVGPRRGGLLRKQLVARYPNLLARWYLAVLSKQENSIAT